MECTTICPLCVDFREGGKPEYPEKNPRSTSEMNISGTLPEAGNLKLIITRPLPEKTYAAIEGECTKTD